jgi:hypothetical protein
MCFPNTLHLTTMSSLSSEDVKLKDGWRDKQATLPSIADKAVNLSSKQELPGLHSQKLINSQTLYTHDPKGSRLNRCSNKFHTILSGSSSELQLAKSHEWCSDRRHLIKNDIRFSQKEIRLPIRLVPIRDVRI